jgi:hypothetical protein
MTIVHIDQIVCPTQYIVSFKTKTRLTSTVFKCFIHFKILISIIWLVQKQYLKIPFSYNIGTICPKIGSDARVRNCKLFSVYMMESYSFIVNNC